MPTAAPRVRSAARSLADDIRARSDDQLRALIGRRPDLARPAPSDLTSLAARASTRASVQRALDGLDLGHLQVLEALVAGADPVDQDAAAELVGVGRRALRPFLDHLWDLALVWRGADGAHVVRAVTDVLSPNLGPNPGPNPAVALPPEVAQRLRAGRTGGVAALAAPELAVAAHPADAVDATAGGQASELLGLVDELAADWGPRPPRVLRAGGLAVRDLRRLATVLDLGQDHAAFVAEIAYAAGLVADDGSLEPVWAPTPAYDEWQQLPSAQRWATLAVAWLGSGRAAHLAGSTPAGGSGSINALSGDVLWPPVRQLRADVLCELADLPPGAAARSASLQERVRWRRPLRRGGVVDAVVAAVAREAEWLGVTGRGALSSAGRALLSGTAPTRVSTESADSAAAAASAMADHLPSPVEHVLLQADLTAVAPGRLEGSLAQFMRLVADVESRGGATVYRFSPDSLRRGLDAGWSAAQILAALHDASRTPVPQPLEYLVGDVARRHGRTRVGGVEAYVRSDDEAVLDAMVADRGLAPLRLRRIAPTVLVTAVHAVTVLELLRDNGFAPVVESADGGVLVPPTSHHRTPARRPPGAQTRSFTVDDELTATLVAALRAGERSAEFARAHEESMPGPRLPSTDPSVTLALLRDAAADRHGLWIGYADGEGRASRVLFFPRRVEGGRAYGTVEGSNVERTFSIHRVTGAAPA